MRVLVINAGSSSVKVAVYDVDDAFVRFESDVAADADAIEGVLGQIPALLERAGEMRVDAIGHRVAHGGDQFHQATLIDGAVIEAIESLSPLAPLHNPPALFGIRTALRQWPLLPQVAVFDTAFHASMPACASTYALPQAWREAGLRRYGFHGTSHEYVMERTAQALQTSANDLRIVSCHLGNGASICAIDRGRSVDTSMGVTPLEGLVMGTRAGDIDPGMFGHLHRTLGLTVDAFEHALYHESGLAALSGLSHDVRQLEAAAADGHEGAQLALAVFAYRARKYVGAFAATMGGCDVVAFTGGIGENSADMRRRICDRLEFLGLHLDSDHNEHIELDGFAAAQIHQPHSRVRVIVTRSREQWMIARQVSRLLNGSAAN